MNVIKKFNVYKIKVISTSEYITLVHTSTIDEKTLNKHKKKIGKFIYFFDFNHSWK